MPLVPAEPAPTLPQAALDSADAVERRLAVADCARSEPLFSRLDVETDAGVRHAILTRLGTLAEEGLDARLAALLGSEEVALRNDAILALRRRGEAGLPVLALALASPEPDVRILAANTLEGISAPRARALLTALLAREADAAVCLAGVEALAQIGTPQDAPALRALRARFAADPCLGFAIGLALDTIGQGA